MPRCSVEGCSRTAYVDSGYCTLHLHKSSVYTTPLEKACAALGGVAMHTLVDTETFNWGADVTEDLMNKCDTKFGKSAVEVTGFVVTEAASVAVQGAKHIGTVLRVLDKLG